MNSKCQICFYRHLTVKRLKKKKRICYEKLHLRKTFIKFSRKRQDTLGGFFMKIEKLFMLMKVKRETTLYPPFPEILLLYLILFSLFKTVCDQKFNCQCSSEKSWIYLRDTVNINTYTVHILNFSITIY